MPRIPVVLAAAALLLFVWLYRKVVKLKVWVSLWNRIFARPNASAVEFYQRMQQILAGKGMVRLPHQTPLEFAYSLGIPEVVRVTEKYNQVRFGDRGLERDEITDLDRWIEIVEKD